MHTKSADNPSMLHLLDILVKLFNWLRETECHRTKHYWTFVQNRRISTFETKPPKPYSILQRLLTSYIVSPIEKYLWHDLFKYLGNLQLKVKAPALRRGADTVHLFSYICYPHLSGDHIKMNPCFKDLRKNSQHLFISFPL